MYQEIARRMETETGIQITASHCENRWRHLERMYKKYIDDNRQTGRGRRDFEYASIMEEILGNKRNINPICVLSTDAVVAISTNENIDSQKLQVH
ncbi:Myb/SANT-like DNA-binding domain [Popillia japonica]|uniref:Myb/SANT-like DNA-binding domain n=1 Tax=Popillia japonica TaxID=7064 RepID=A0AAW1IGB6_POPJA